MQNKLEINADSDSRFKRYAILTLLYFVMF